MIIAAASPSERVAHRTPLHRQPAMATYAPAPDALRVTEELARTNLALMSPALDDDRVGEVVTALAALISS